MKILWALIIKELKSYFLSPLAYILSAIFIFLTGWSFYNILEIVNSSGQDPIETLITGHFSNINTYLMFMVPLVTMRLFSEEKKMQTLQVLLLSKLDHFSIVLGKFTAAFLVFIFMLGISLIFPLILWFSGQSLGILVWSAYLGTLLNVACYVSVGIFSSVLTKNQLLSALISFLIFFIFYLFAWSAYTSENQFVANILQYLSIGSHLQGALSGLIQSYDFVFFGSFIAFFLFATKKSLESRFW